MHVHASEMRTVVTVLLLLLLPGVEKTGVGRIVACEERKMGCVRDVSFLSTSPYSLSSEVQ